MRSEGRLFQYVAAVKQKERLPNLPVLVVDLVFCLMVFVLYMGNDYKLFRV